ncbi:MAG: DNA polymerase I [Candidatus Omnitrophica bacterium]|nr:DNA polymerase I [Candidatus Omnitrophota bacterium]MDD5429528.1 DNA polymerase I [Candidatus Omnitrophota bacterium]
MLKKTVYLVDGTSLCYRSFFAIKLSTSQGVATGAVYGVYQTLKKIISAYQPQYLGVCFDVSRKTFRQEKYREYKINRPPLPDGLKTQIPMVRKLIGYMGIKIVEKEGFEADDVIATLSTQAVESGNKVVIVSSDKDLCQLMENDKVAVYNYNKDMLFTKQDFKKEYGFSPAKIIDFLALAGDSADNIPGARGIGKVGATKLVQEFGEVENIFNNLDKLPSRLRSIMEESKEIVLLSKELVRLSVCSLNTGWQELEIGQPDSESIYDMFSRLEFKNLLKGLPQAPSNFDVPLKQDIPEYKKTENPVSFFLKEDKAFVYSDEKECVYSLSLPQAQEFFRSYPAKKVAYGAKNQFMIFAGTGSVWFDVKIAAYLIDSGLNDYSLESLIFSFLGERILEVPDEIKPYFINRLYVKFLELLKSENLDKLFFDVEMPLVYVLEKMQSDGVKIDLKVMKKLLIEVGKETDVCRRRVFELAGKEFNLNSPKQLRSILFEDLKIKPVKKTKTGFSTSEEVLEKLASKYPIAGFILEYRYLNKLKTTYIIPLIEDVEKNNGILHAQFNQAVAQTGRLSSSSPNLQSIPAKGKFSQGLRQAFIPSCKDGYILSGDYSQIELRILAHLSGDRQLIEAFSKDLDIHRFTAKLLFSTPLEEVTEAQRNIAKRVNFGIIYGMSSYGLSRELGVSPAEAQSFIDDYFRRYEGIKQYIDNICQQAESSGFVTTILGRRKKLADIKSPNLQLREFSRRQAVNAPIQGSCADLIKVAMVDIQRRLWKDNLKTKLIIQIHDELIFDVFGPELETIKEMAIECMEKAIKLSVPVKVNIKYGPSWGQLQKN